MTETGEEITAPGGHVSALRAELRHVKERHDDWNGRQDERLNSHAKRLRSLEMGQWKMAGIAGGLALLGAGLGAWLAAGAAFARLMLTAKGG